MATNRTKVAKWIRDMLPKKCCNCGSTENLGYHHIVPCECGGNDVPTNVAVLCANCHSRVHYGRDGVIDHGTLISAGMAKAREKGVKLGRKKRVDSEYVMRTIAENSTQFNDINDIDYEPMTEHEIMDKIGIKEVQYAKYKRMLIDTTNADIWPYDWPKPKQIRKMPLYDRVIKKMRGDIA